MTDDNPNDRQVGGDHYASEYQHWDLVVDTGMDYLAGCATKYISRHRKKGGVQDLEKAAHYLDKLIEVWEERSAPPVHSSDTEDCDRFIKANNLPPMEGALVRVIATWTDIGQLRAAREALEVAIAAERHRRLLEEGFKVPETGVSGRTEHPSPFGFTEEAEEDAQG